MAVSEHVYDDVVRGAISAIDHVAQAQNFPAERVKAMRFHVDCQYRIESDEVVLRVAWRDPDGDNIRSFSQLLGRDLLADRRDSLYEVLRMSVEQINLRGELFYFKLHKHFPNRIESVKCNRAGEVTVTFKNGRSLTTDDAALDSTEFLATCGMIYDL